MKETQEQGEMFPEEPRSSKLKKIIRQHEAFDEMKKKETPEERLKRIAKEIKDSENPNWENLKESWSDKNNKK